MAALFGLLAGLGAIVFLALPFLEMHAASKK